MRRQLMASPSFARSGSGCDDWWDPCRRYRYPKPTPPEPDGPPALPSIYAYLLGRDGAYLLGADGAYLYGMA